MYPVSNDFLEAIKARSRECEYSGTITNGNISIDFSKADIKQGSASLTRETTGDNTFRFGGGCSAELSISFKATRIDIIEGASVTIDFLDYLVEGSKIELNYTLVTDATTTPKTTETIPIGVYYVQSVKRGVSNYVSVVAYDSMYKLHKQIDFTAYRPPTTFTSPYSWLNYICNACGVVLGHTEAQIEALPNGDVSMAYQSENGAPEWFDLLRSVTEMLACFAYIGRDDVLYLRQYSTTSDITLDDSVRYNAEVEDFESFYTSIYGSTQEITVAESTDNGLRYETDNPFVFPTKAIAESVYGVILDELEEIQYRPLSITVLTNPALDPGDMITILHGSANNPIWSFVCPIMKITYTLYGNCSIEGYGDNPNAKDTNGSVSRAISGINQTVTANTKNIEELKQSAIVFLLPTQTDDDPIDDGDSNTVATWVIQCAEGAEVAIHFTLGFEVETTAVADTSYGDAELTAIIKVDGTTEETLTETYGDGEHILTINHIMTMATEGIHEITIDVSMSGGDLT